MVYITFNHIIELNKKITEKELPYKIHLSDRCGGQSMWIEELEVNKENMEDLKRILYPLIEDFFKDERINLEFSQDLMTFWVEQLKQ